MSRIVWLDVESTGIDPHKGEKLLQIACIVTDTALNEVGEGFEMKVKYSYEEAAEMYASAVPFVRDMHSATGLWKAIQDEGRPLVEVEDELLAYLAEQGVEAGQARLGGNSITLDRNFLSVFMPRVLAYLHYRSLDMTSVGGFMELFRPDVKQFEKAKTHDALDDIRESLGEARHYAKALGDL